MRKRHGRKHRRRSGRDGGGRPEPSDFDSPQCLPGRGAFPCAGGERPPRHHLLRPAGCSAPQGAGAQPGLPAGEVAAPGRDGPSAGGHHRRDALCPPGGGGGLGQLPRASGWEARRIRSPRWARQASFMCLGNGYAVYDVGFELSFAAVMGTLAGAECAGRGWERYYDRKKKRKSRREKHHPAQCSSFRRFAGGVVGLALRLPLCLGGDLPGAGAAGDEHDSLGCGVGRGRPLAGGADAELRPRCSYCWVWPRRALPLFEIIRRPGGLLCRRGWYG